MHQFDDAPLFYAKRRYTRLHIPGPFSGTHAPKAVGFAATHFAGFGQLLVIVKMSDTEVSPPQKGLKVGKLQNPRPDAAAGGVVSLLL